MTVEIVRNRVLVPHEGGRAFVKHCGALGSVWLERVKKAMKTF